MGRQPEMYRARTGGSGRAGLTTLAVAAAIGAIVGLGWWGRQAEEAASRPDASGTSPAAAELPAAQASASPRIAVPRAPIVGDVAIYDPEPGSTVPGSGILGVSGQVLTYAPRRIVARLRILGRPDVVAPIEDVRDGAYSGWLVVPPPGQAVNAVLEISDGTPTLAPTQPLARVRFRLGPPPPVTIATPTVPFEVITTPGLRVAGTAAPGVLHVLVRLEARNNRLIDRAVVTTDGSTSGSGIRDRRPYEVTFRLPAVHPNGVMFIEVYPVDGVAEPERYGLRLAVEIGPLAP